MNKRRLLKLAALLIADAKNKKGSRFDLESWASNMDGNRMPQPSKFKVLDCNTSACAVGLACLSGAFKRSGLSWRSHKEDNNIIPIFKGQEGFGAVEEFFGIDFQEAEWLFVVHSYDGPTMGAAGERAVANRIRRFVAGKESPQS
jgi:hypothetical protein